jgi:Cu/Zn superoxide dismutase
MYPGYSGDYRSVAGFVVVEDTESGLKITGTLTGVEASVSGGIHIHEGVSCATSSDPGGHYYDGMSSDPWTTTYTSRSDSAASVSFTIDDFSLGGDYPVAGRVIVVHASNGDRIGCGEMVSTTGKIVHMDEYPDYSGSYDVIGTLLVDVIGSQKQQMLSVMGTLAGLEAGVSGGLHVHSGYSCASTPDVATSVGGHYYEGMASDPWTTMYNSDGNGFAQVQLYVDDFTMTQSYPVSYRAMVVHLSSGSGSTRVGCGLIGEPMIAVANMSVYPGVDASSYDYNYNAFAGTVAVSDSDDGIIIMGTITGVNGNEVGGFHIHEGVSCASSSDPGGHYYNSSAWSSDPWTTTYSAMNGAANVSIAMAGFSLTGEYAVAGRVLVAHDASGNRIGCGVLESTPGHVVNLASYPDYSGSYNEPFGTFLVEESNSGVTIEGTLGNVAPSCVDCGIHIHSGFTCDDADGVGGHFYDSDYWDSDPWTTTYSSNAKGHASVSVSVDGFSTASAFNLPTAYHALVVHDSTDRVGCGIIGTPYTAVSTLGSYPDYSGSLSVNGTIAVTETDNGIIMFGTLTGVEASVSGGIHIHEGVSCATTSDPGGHYFPGMSSDPWSSTTYESNADGLAGVNFKVDSFSLAGTNPVAGRVVVVHDSSGTRVACGVLESTVGEVVTFGKYPDSSTSYDVSGTLLVEPYIMGIELTGTLGGLESNAVGGIHIHSGYTVDDADGVDGHYFDSAFWDEDPWTTTYSSDMYGYASCSFSMNNFSMTGVSEPVSLRAMVVHLSSGTRAGAGLIATRSAADVYVSPYSAAPTIAPSMLPIYQPTIGPSFQPSLKPSSVPTIWVVPPTTTAPTPSPFFSPTSADEVDISVSLSLTADSESDITSSGIFPAVAAAIDSITVDDLFNFEQTWTASRRVRRLLSGSSVVTFDIRASLATVGFSDASSFESEVESDLSNAVSSGSLASNIETNCGCTLSVESISVALSRAYPTFSPTPLPNRKHSDDDDTTAIVIGSIAGAIGFVILVFVAGYMFGQYRRQRFAAEHTLENEGDSSTPSLFMPNPISKQKTLELSKRGSAISDFLGKSSSGDIVV